MEDKKKEVKSPVKKKKEFPQLSFAEAVRVVLKAGKFKPKR